MTPRLPLHLVLPSLALGTALVLVRPHSEAAAFVLNGSSLGTQQRDLRVFDNFADPESNDNVIGSDQFPNVLGVELAIWKGMSEWGSVAHGTGKGDPLQNRLGNGTANFDAIWMGNATARGGINENIVSAIPACGAGLIAFVELPSNNGWRTSFCDGNFVFDDEPGKPAAIHLDTQSVMTHEFGHALGLGHSAEGSATMWAALGPGGTRKRSLHADDIAGLQAIYGVLDPTKPLIWKTDGNGGSGVLTIIGERFDPVDNNVWFTPSGTTAPSADPRVRLLAVPSTNGGTRIDVTIPAGAGPGDVLVKNGAISGTVSLSNAFPTDLVGENVSPVLAPFSLLSVTPSTVDALDPGTAQSVTLTGFQLDSTTSIELNSVPVDPARWTAVDDQTITIDLPQGLLGANTLELTDGASSQSIPITIVEPTSPKFELGTGDPGNVVTAGSSLGIIVSGTVGTAHRVYYSPSNVPSVHPLATFDMGNAFSQFFLGGTFTVGPEGYTQFAAPVPFGGPSPKIFYSQSIDVTTPPSPEFGVSNLQSITLTP